MMSRVLVIDQLRQDLVFAARLLRGTPAFTAAAVLTLALGIGVNTAVFSILNAFILRPLPVRDGERIVVLANRSAANPALGGLSFPDLQSYRAATRDVFEDIAGYTVGFVGMTPPGGRPDRVLVTWVTGNYFRLLGLHAALGRLLHDDDDAGAGRTDPVIVLGYSTWRRRFGSDASVVGKTARVNGRPCTIIGVAPPGFHGTFAFSESELFLPLNFVGVGDPDRRDARFLHAPARLRPEASLARARAAVAVVSRRLENEFPATNTGVVAEVHPERLARPEEHGARANALAASLVLALVGLVLLVAGVNLTNLMLARALGRRRELAIRAALGAGRARLARQLVTESLVLAVLGGGAGILLGIWTARLLTAVRLPGDLPVRFDFRFDLRVIGFAVALVVGIGLTVGIVVALRASRGSLEQTLREPGSGAGFGAGLHRPRSALVVAQIAACLVLLVSAGLFARSLARAERSDLGFRPAGVLNVHMDVGQLGYTESRAGAFFEGIEREVRRLPGVEKVSFAFTVPMGYVRLGETIDAEHEALPPERRPFAGRNMVSPEYFATMGIPIVRGRAFQAGDDVRSRPVAIVNERLADVLWPKGDPIGRRFSASGPVGPWLEVVGVTSTGKYRLLFEDPMPFFYVPMAQQPTSMRVLQVRSSTPPEALAPVVERLIQQREPDLAVYDVQSMTRALEGGYGFFLLRVAATAMSAFGALGLMLATVGVYGVVSFLASQRTREIGVRVALGATPGDVVRLVLRDGITPVAIGIGLGQSIAVAFAPLIGGFLFGVPARDPLTLLAVPPVLAGVAILASMIPAWRAVRVDPTITLRAE